MLLKVSVYLIFMKMFYLPETPFGEFFYDPESHQGVAISESGLVILGILKITILQPFQIIKNVKLLMALFLIL